MTVLTEADPCVPPPQSSLLPTMARVRRPSPTPQPKPFPWASLKAETLRAICAQVLDSVSTSPSPSTSARAPGSSKTSIADAVKQSRQKLRTSRKDMISFLEGVCEYGRKLFILSFQTPLRDLLLNATVAGLATGAAAMN